MKYLDCIEILNYALDILKSGQRNQIAVSKLSELVMVLVSANRKMEQESEILFKSTFNDLIQAIAVVQDMRDVKFLNDNMKQTLVDGVLTLKGVVAQKAYEYYSVHDFEPTEEIIPRMRDVVTTYIEGGGVV